MKNSGSGLENRLTAVGTRYADHALSLYPQKLALISPTSSGRSVGIVPIRTKGHGVCFLVYQTSYVTSKQLHYFICLRSRPCTAAGNACPDLSSCYPRLCNCWKQMRVPYNVAQPRNLKSYFMLI
jgi:hypothetical protein